MKLYQSNPNLIRHLALLIYLILMVFLIAGCTSPQVQPEEIEVNLIVDGATIPVLVQPGTTGQQAFEIIGITIDSLDRSDPPLYSVLTEGSTVSLTRVAEEFVIEEIVVPYETQLLRNESLPEGDRRLLQTGSNGMMENTYRVVYENGLEVSRSLVKSIIVQTAQPEINMVGSQSAFVSVDIPGILAYISAGNAWVMDGNTGLRRPIVTTGDLDGRIFELSPDHQWLMFTRSDEDKDIINTLWVARVTELEDVEAASEEFENLIDLDVTNVIHFAAWVPGADKGVVYSSVEPSPTSPGWQANNDLLFVNFSEAGWASPKREAIEANSGGKYGWWGTSFAWSPDGEQLAYARPDGIGLVDFETEELVPLANITPLVTRADWVWVPSLGWAPDGNFIFTIDHVPQAGLTSPEDSPLFDVAAVPISGGVPYTLVEKTGMFAFPTPSVITETTSGEQSYQVAYLQALLPTESDTSQYQIVVMDRDGSNQRVLYPAEGAPGVDSQPLYWSPDGNGMIAFLYQGNLWFLDINSGESQQLTGDGLTTALDWE